VYLSDDSHLEIFGYGKFEMKFFYGRIININGMLYIPRSTQKKLSVRKIIDVGA
jgi:hypothetical protein